MCVSVLFRHFYSRAKTTTTPTFTRALWKKTQWCLLKFTCSFCFNTSHPHANMCFTPIQWHISPCPTNKTVGHPHIRSVIILAPQFHEKLLCSTVKKPGLVDIRFDKQIKHSAVRKKTDGPNAKSANAVTGFVNNHSSRGTPFRGFHLFVWHRGWVLVCGV